MLANNIAFNFAISAIIGAQIEISNFKEFNDIRSNPNGNFVLTDDIQIPFDGDGISSWIPFQFGGSLDGAGHAILGLYVSDTSSKYIGLFSSISSTSCPNLLQDDSAKITKDTCSSTTYSSIKNLRISGSKITAKGSSGLLAGIARNAMISNVHVDGFVSGNIDVGGIFGQAGPFVTIKNSSADIVAMGNMNIGGLVGSAYWVDLKNSSCKGSLTGYQNIGGCVGRAEATIGNELTSEAEIRSKISAGGIFGLFLGTNIGERRISTPSANQSWILSFLSQKSSCAIPDNSSIQKFQKPSYLFMTEDSRSIIIESDIFSESDSGKWSNSTNFMQMYRESSLSNVVSSGNIRCDSFCGGIIGRSEFFPTGIKGAIHSGRVFGSSKVGAIAGKYYSQSGAREVIISGLVNEISAMPLFGVSDGILNDALIISSNTNANEQLITESASLNRCPSNDSNPNRCKGIFPDGVFAWNGKYFRSIGSNDIRKVKNHLNLEVLRTTCCSDRNYGFQENKPYRLPALQESEWWGDYLPPFQIGKPIAIKQGECINLIDHFTTLDKSIIEFHTDELIESTKIQGSYICVVGQGERKPKQITLNARTKRGGNLWSKITVLPSQK